MSNTYNSAISYSPPPPITWWENVRSWLLGHLDLVVYLLRINPYRPKFFMKGWGDLNKADYEARKLEKYTLLKKLPLDTGVDIENLITWRNSKEEGEGIRLEAEGVYCRRGFFVSPAAESLPKESRLCEVMAICPTGALWAPRSSIEKLPKGVLILLPATAEETDDMRQRQAVHLSQQYGWSSIIVTSPYYGIRRPANQPAHYLCTVADMLLQSTAIMQEAALLACWVTERWKDSIDNSYNSNSSGGGTEAFVKCTISGYSWGGAMTGSAAKLVTQWCSHPERVGCVPFVGCCSPGTLVDSILSADICWSALRNKHTAAELPCRYGELTLSGRQTITAGQHLACTESSVTSNSSSDSSSNSSVGESTSQYMYMHEHFTNGDDEEKQDHFLDEEWSQQETHDYLARCLYSMNSLTFATWLEQALLMKHTSIDSANTSTASAASADVTNGSSTSMQPAEQLQLLAVRQTHMQRLGAVHCVSMRHDFIITTRFGAEMNDSLKQFCSADRYQVDWYPGGHVMGFLLRGHYWYNA